MQQPLTARDIVDEGLRLWEPCLVALEEEPDAIECHTWLAVQPGVMRIDMEEQAIHTQGEVAVQQGLDARRCLVPHATYLRKALCLNDLLSIDMRSADGIEHVVGLVVSRRVEPVFAHRDVYILVMVHAIRNHCGRHAL